MDRKNRNHALLRTMGAGVVACLAIVSKATAEDVARAADPAKPQVAGVALPPVNPLNAQRAYGYLLQLCAIGPRPSGSAGMAKQQALLEDFFKKAGGKVSVQQFRANDPLSGNPVEMANII